MSKTKLSFEEVKIYIESFGYKLLSTEYTGIINKLKIQCPMNHIYSVRFSSFKEGIRCPDCFGNKKYTLKFVRKYIESFGYKLLSTEYNNIREKLKIQCNKGHNYKVSFSCFKKGHRCSICNFSNRLLSTEFVKEYIESFGHHLLSTEYKGNKTKLIVKCPYGHVYNPIFNNFKKGSRCPICCDSKSFSKDEKEVYGFVKSIYNGTIIPNDRTVINNPNTGYNLELDIWLPEIKKAIEFNGKYWHSSNYSKVKDQIKVDQCKKLNIDLLVINEQDWINSKENCLYSIKDFILI